MLTFKGVMTLSATTYAHSALIRRPDQEQSYFGCMFLTIPFGSGWLLSCHTERTLLAAVTLLYWHALDPMQCWLHVESFLNTGECHMTLKYTFRPQLPYTYLRKHTCSSSCTHTSSPHDLPFSQRGVQSYAICLMLLASDNVALATAVLGYRHFVNPQTYSSQMAFLTHSAPVSLVQIYPTQ